MVGMGSKHALVSELSAHQDVLAPTRVRELSRALLQGRRDSGRSSNRVVGLIRCASGGEAAPMPFEGG